MDPLNNRVLDKILDDMEKIPEQSGNPYTESIKATMEPHDPDPQLPYDFVDQDWDGLG